MTKIAIIIPSFNESENLENLINEINLNLKNVEIFIVDDSKDDYSEKILNEKKNVNFFHRGKKLGRGSAVIFGLKESEISIIITPLDAAYSVPVCCPPINKILSLPIITADPLSPTGALIVFSDNSL